MNYEKLLSDIGNVSTQTLAARSVNQMLLKYLAIAETSLTQILLSFQGNISLSQISQTVSGLFEFSDKDLLEILSKTQDKEKLIQPNCSQGRNGSAIRQAVPAKSSQRLQMNQADFDQPLPALLRGK